MPDPRNRDLYKPLKPDPKPAYLYKYETLSPEQKAEFKKRNPNFTEIDKWGQDNSDVARENGSNLEYLQYLASLLTDHQHRYYKVNEVIKEFEVTPNGIIEKVKQEWT